MILAIQSLFGQGVVLLLKEQKVSAAFSWDTGQKECDVVEAIAQVLAKAKCTPADIREIFAVQGPGPFTAVRSIAITMEVWRSQLLAVRIYAIPSGIFLKAKFPEAEHLFLGAGSQAFFYFEREHPEKFQKFPVPTLQNFPGTYGGFFSPETILPPELKLAKESDAAKTFQNLFPEKKSFRTMTFQPIYGAKPNIRR